MAIAKTFSAPETTAVQLSLSDHAMCLTSHIEEGRSIKKLIGKKVDSTTDLCQLDFQQSRDKDRPYKINMCFLRNWVNRLEIWKNTIRGMIFDSG